MISLREKVEKGTNTLLVKSSFFGKQQGCAWKFKSRAACDPEILLLLSVKGYLCFYVHYGIPHNRKDMELTYVPINWQTKKMWYFYTKGYYSDIKWWNPAINNKNESVEYYAKWNKNRSRKKYYKISGPGATQTKTDDGNPQSSLLPCLA